MVLRKPGGRVIPVPRQKPRWGWIHHLIRAHWSRANKRER